MKYKSELQPRNYQGKIEYYQAQLSNAVDTLDLPKIKFLTTKLEYFMSREATRLERMSQLEF
mgnify:CR=1 FL=1